ncbi:TRAP transporter, 4TM/12TM fusion protein [Enhydrobacter aerosaccus]|uniref:TRAP transporter, 4TM/12TM fusion protein n=1 Tax=Enhydrobacter aerosaccus TaxID=225324 RepID=A0A1T4NFY3_9HYPH|nr:TRAP transporter permease [Enhydrobacter aerosaccus]SJZ78055.1 TRAP transporter, 4TM/12TM fusion protein [Enhydrobacter aerosaccus]
MSDVTAPTASREALENMVAEADTGGRKPTGVVKRLIFGIALCWALFQLWYASPLPYLLNVGVFNDGQARVIHLCFAFLLAFTSFPAFKRSPRDRVPVTDWILAGLGIVSAGYLLLFYRELSQRSGLPTTPDVVVSVIGVLLLLEAARRAVGPALTAIAALMLIYMFAGPWMPGMLAHKGASLPRAASQMWLTSEGIFGVALGVSTNVVFFFVLFGSLLEKAGAGNYFIQLAFALLGTFRGGPAKAGVVASGMTGMISGSSVANTVTTGTFTIPLMKRVGYSAVKAGAIECAAGVNGQLMPPVMGAAAFLIAEYVGISYAEVVKHAFVPAFLTYGALFYIVDIEAAKAGLRGLPRTSTVPLHQSFLRGLMTICGIIVLSGIVYWGVGWTKDVFGAAASWILGVVLIAAYLGLVRYKARHADLPMDDPSKAIVKVPDFYDTARTGLHYLLPVVVLIWCLMIEQLSPGLSAFWGTMFLIFIMLTQRPLLALFRRERQMGRQLREGFRDLASALESASRNMTSVGIATAAAGIIVGTVSFTGIGLVMTEIVESASGGSLIIMLILTAFICLLLGIGMPTTANYVVVATLMAPVLVEVAQQNDLAVPLVAVHMFVFYFGLMADVHPPVGLAAYAAAAISGADPIKTGLQGFWYEIRTGLLPFIFIFNSELLLIDIGGPFNLVMVIACSIVAMGCFVAATQNWLLTRNRWYETALLLLICFTLFRPAFWLDQFKAPFNARPPAEIAAVAGALPEDQTLRFRAMSQSRSGEDVEKTVRLTMKAGKDGADRLRGAGLVLTPGDKPTVQSVRFGSEAAKYGLAPGDEILAVLVPADRPNRYWMAVPALLLLGVIILLQLRRRRPSEPRPAVAMARP